MVGRRAGSYHRGEHHQGGQMRELTQPTSVLRLLLAGPDVGNGLRPNRSGQRAQPTWIRGFESQGGDPMVCRDRLTLEGEPMTFSGWSPNSAGTHLLGAFLPGPCSWAPPSPRRRPLTRSRSSTPSSWCTEPSRTLAAVSSDPLGHRSAPNLSKYTSLRKAPRTSVRSTHPIAADCIGTWVCEGPDRVRLS